MTQPNDGEVGMTLEVRRYPSAQLDIDAAVFWLDERNPPAADRLIDRMEELFAMLAEQPLIGRRRDELHVGLRSFPSDEFVIFYLPTPGTIDLVRILGAKQDVSQIDFAATIAAYRP